MYEFPYLFSYKPTKKAMKVTSKEKKMYLLKNLSLIFRCDSFPQASSFKSQPELHTLSFNIKLIDKGSKNSKVG